MADTPRPEPTTQAGRDLDELVHETPRILAVEAEARDATGLREVREALLAYRATFTVGPEVVEQQARSTPGAAEVARLMRLADALAAAPPEPRTVPDGNTMHSLRMVRRYVTEGLTPFTRNEAIAYLDALIDWTQRYGDLAAAPPEPRTITEKVDAIEAAIHPEGRCVKCGGGKPYWKHVDAGQPVADFHEFQPPPEPRWPSRDELAKALDEINFDEFDSPGEFDPGGMADAILAALREGGEQP